MRLPFALSRSFALISLAVWVGGCPVAVAQGTNAPSLGEVLQRLEANLNHYDAGVPSLFCDENVVSSKVEPHERDRDTVTESVFRLKRTAQADHTTALVESREIKSVDGRAPKSGEMDGPALLSGIFEGGLAVVSVGQTSCMNYRLERVNRKKPGEPYVVRFATVLTPRNTAGCFLQEESKGRVLIDPASMQVKRLEITTPHHLIEDEDYYSSRVVGRRELTVEYAPVLMGGETFWMPSAIGMQTTRGEGFDRTVWSFDARYRNYHRLEVKSKILDGPE